MRLREHTLVLAGILLTAFVVAYWVPLKAMANIWWSNDDYSYAMIIPLVAAYMIWDRRSSLATAPISSSWTFLPLLLFFAALSLYGVLGSSGNISMPAIPILVLLFVGFCFGAEMLKRLAVPLGFLIFMVPIPASLERTIGLLLKSVSSRLGGAIIDCLNIPVHVSGNIIDLGATQLQVVDACSGLRYLFPLAAIGVFYGYFFQRALWKRLLCVLVTIPLAVLTNSFRIGLTGILANSYGSGVAEGFFHGFSGWVLFVVCFVVLFLLGKLLSILFPDTVDGLIYGPAVTLDPRLVGATLKPFVISLLLLAVVGLFSWNTYALPSVKLRGGIESFPVNFKENWQGRSLGIEKAVVEESGAESAFNAAYRGKDDREVTLYLGYRSTAFLANENFFHSPTVCLPASGWNTSPSDVYTVSNVPYFGGLRVSTMEMELLGSRQLVYFWFQTKDRSTHDKNVNRFHLTMHALKRDNTHDLFIRTITPIYSGESLIAAHARMDRFVRDMMTALLQFLKERQQTEGGPVPVH